VSDLDSERLAVLVHEVRSPVAALGAIAGTLAEGRLDAAGRRSLVELATVACRGIERIVTDASVASVRLQVVDPVELVRGVVAAASVRGGAVELTVRGRVPRVRADPGRLRQALDNVVGNALLHAGSAAPVSVVVHVDTMVRIEVSDRGPGIPPEDLERIFEPRVRLDPEASDGAGFGLALATAIAQGHGGSLTVESSLGEGSTFTLALPLES
jgi:signal transduction histidine kinase